MDNQIDPKSALATKFALTPCMDPPSPPALPLAHCKHPSLQAAPRTPRFPGASQAAEATPQATPERPLGTVRRATPEPLPETLRMDCLNFYMDFSLVGNCHMNKKNRNFQEEFQ